MKLRKQYFWIVLNEQNAINCPKEFERDVLNTFCVRRVKKTQSVTKNAWTQRVCLPEILWLLKASFSLIKYTWRAKTFINFYFSKALQIFVVNLGLACAKSHLNEEKWRQQRFSYREKRWRLTLTSLLKGNHNCVLQGLHPCVTRAQKTATWIGKSPSPERRTRLTSCIVM